MSYIRAGLGRILILLVLWWALAEGDTHGWPFALGSALAATLLSLALLPPPPWRLRWLAIPGFLAFFLRAMFIGGVDVARRALQPSMPVLPGFLTYRLRLASDAARLLMTWTVGLLPGTVSVELQQSALEVHVLDTRMPVEATLTRLEERIAALFE